MQGYFWQARVDISSLSVLSETKSIEVKLKTAQALRHQLKRYYNIISFLKKTYLSKLFFYDENYYRAIPHHLKTLARITDNLK